MTRQSARHAARERAFQLLYSLNFVPVADAIALALAFSQAPDSGISNVESPNKTLNRFTWELVHGVWERRAAIDMTISKLSQHWRIERIGYIELTILRLALHEMLHRIDIPNKVAINEAIELAKRFGDDNSCGFVNGILNTAVQALNRDNTELH